MADPDEYRLKFITEADTAGAEKVLSVTKETGEVAKGASALAVTGNAGVSASADKAGGSLRDVGLGLKSMRAGLGAVSAISHGDFSGGMHAATFAVKGLNAAMRANPAGLLISGLVLAASVAIPMFLGKTKETEAELGKVKDKAGDAGDELEKVKTAAEHAADGFKSADDWASALDENMSKASKSAAELRTRLDALEDSQLALQEAQIDYDKSLGNVSPEKAELLKANARSESELRKVANARSENDTKLSKASSLQETNAREIARTQAERDAAEAEEKKKSADAERFNDLSKTAKAGAFEAMKASKGTDDKGLTSESNLMAAAAEKSRDEAEAAKARRIAAEARLPGLRDTGEKLSGEVAGLQSEGVVLKNRAEAATLKGGVAAGEAGAASEKKAQEDRKKNDELSAQITARQTAEDKKRASDAHAASVNAAKEKELAAKNDLEEFNQQIKGASERKQKSKATAAKRQELESRVEQAKAGVLEAEQGELTPEQQRALQIKQSDAGGRKARGPRERVPIDAHAPQAHPEDGLRGGTPLEGDDAFHDRFKRHLDFRVPQRGGGDDGHADLEKAAADVKSAGVQQAAAALQQLAPAITSLVSAVNASTGQIPQIWQAISALQSERTGSVG